MGVPGRGCAVSEVTNNVIDLASSAGPAEGKLKLLPPQTPGQTPPTGEKKKIALSIGKVGQVSALQAGQVVLQSGVGVGVAVGELVHVVL
ncbi:hypothetical protein EYF80_014418 [Liparis tanakae]|uniref:Uncharacterized protein n=1 Tax=Liparis tanakae TaxID=230148 RepID=A0A4Z2ICC9_9TELE|nr:hypothetical protein EYF80_014418 [Liparis tanakae]